MLNSLSRAISLGRAVARITKNKSLHVFFFWLLLDVVCAMSSVSGESFLVTLSVVERLGFSPPPPNSARTTFLEPTLKTSLHSPFVPCLPGLVLIGGVA